MNDLSSQYRVESENGVERFFLGSTLLALIVRAHHQKEGISFFTPNEFSQQLAYMRHPAEYVVLPHVHNPVSRSVELTQEVLILRKGKVRLDIYSSDHTYLQSCLLYTGDIILLAHGGHGLKMLEESEIVEVKQGPYVGDADKTRFTPANEEHIILPAE